jgi:endonuclease/exonuclease/phosphatase family metal-dependent hydrolase
VEVLVRSRRRRLTLEYRALTYNIQHGKGTDGNVNLPRIAQVIEQSEADLVALNEVDRCFSSRSNYEDQANWLAEKLNMYMVFGPALYKNNQTGLGQYGNAFLSRYPILSAKNHPIRFGTTLIEERSLLEITLSINGKFIKAFITHISPIPFAHKKQLNFVINTISNEFYPSLLLGDFNMIPKSRAWKSISEHASDAWNKANQTKGATFPSTRPILRLDYIFSTPSISVVGAELDQSIPSASDHLPLRVKFRLE